MDDPSLKQGQSAQVPATSGQDTDVTVIPDDEAAGERGKDQAQQKRIMPLKRPNLDVRAEFDLETNGAGKTQAKCKHCKWQGNCPDGQNCDKNCELSHEHRQAANAFGLCVPEGPGGYQRTGLRIGSRSEESKESARSHAVCTVQWDYGKTLSEETLSDVRAGVSVSTPATPGSIQKKDDIKTKKMAHKNKN